MELQRWAALLFVLALILLAVVAVYFPLPHSEQGYFSPLYSPDGAAVYALAKILGHSDAKVTIDRYAPLSREYVQRQRGVIDGMYSAEGKPMPAAG